MIKQAELFLIEFYKSIRSLLIVIVFSKKHKITRCKKKKAIVLMNGPSLLGDIEEDNLSGDIYVSNDFASSKEFFILKPNNYVIVDPFFFQENERSVNIKKILSDAKWEINLYIPVKFQDSFFINIENKLVTIHFFNHYEISGYSSLVRKIFDQQYGMPKCQNVLIAILMICIWKDHKSINLFGTDHNWLHYLSLNSENVLCLSNHRFYDSEEKIIIKPWLDQNGDSYRMDEILIKLSIMFKGYWQVLEYSKIKNIKIINNTQNSLIDAFQKNIKFK
jgi:hypothetical protein